MPDVLSGHYLRGLGPEWLLPVLASARSDPCPALLFHVVFAEYDHWIHIIGVPRLMCCITALCVMMFYVLYCSLIYRCLLPSRFLNRKRFCVQYVFVSLSLSLHYKYQTIIRTCFACLTWNWSHSGLDGWWKFIWPRDAKGKRIWNHLDAGHIAFTTREFSAQSQTLQEDAGSIVGAVDGIGSNSGSVIPEIHSFGIQF